MKREISHELVDIVPDALDVDQSGAGRVQAPHLRGPASAKFVFNIPEAIGHIRVGVLGLSVKAVRLDGRLPGEEGCKLKLGPS